VTGITVHLPDGRDLPATVVGHDPRWGIALLKAELPPSKEGEPVYALPEAPPAPHGAFEAGRFVLAVGNPFGATRLPDPLLTIGILSKQHAEGAPFPWRGDWQTDAGGTDGNVGGAVVDLQGRLVGMMTVWSPSRHGRNSGIAFVVPVDRILAALPAMREGKTPQRGFLGIMWPRKDGQVEAQGDARIDAVVPASAAAAAGIQPGDVLLKVDDQAVGFIAEALQHFAFMWAGDKVRVTVKRGEKTLEMDVVLTPRPSS
jgi:S1-C subfamily serine protease